MSGDPPKLPDDQPCPHCGRPSPASLRGSIRARTLLLRECVDAGLSAQVTADVLAGVRPFPAPTSEGDDQ